MSNNFVYSFYEPISDWKHDKVLVDLWISNWKDRGFEPIVLSKSDAENHPYYEEFVQKIYRTFRQYTGFEIHRRGTNPWDSYIFYNYIRFLAYANCLPADEPSLVMDYDVYNLDYHEHRLSDKCLTFLCNMCPCLVSGTREQFFSYCEWMANEPAKHIDQLKNAGSDGKYSTFHEMAMLTLMCKIDKQPQEINITSGKIILKTAPGHTQPWHKLVHLSRGYLVKFLKETGKQSKDLSWHDMTEMRSARAWVEIGRFETHNL